MPPHSITWPLSSLATRPSSTTDTRRSFHKLFRSQQCYCARTQSLTHIRDTWTFCVSMTSFPAEWDAATHAHTKPQSRRRASARTLAAPLSINITVTARGSRLSVRHLLARTALHAAATVRRPPRGGFGTPNRRVPLCSFQGGAKQSKTMVRMGRGARSNHNNMLPFHGNTKIWYQLAVKRLFEVRYLSQVHC